MNISDKFVSGAVRALRVAMALGALTVPATATAAEINFGVQPILDQKRAREVFQPLADYVGRATGKTVSLKTSYDFADYWLKMKQGDQYNLVLDGPFYTDYLIKEQKFVPLVKVPGVVSHSLVASPTAAFFGPQDLVGKCLATLIPPAPAGLLLARMFPQPTRQPFIVPTKSSEEALEMVLAGKAEAAMVPTPLVAAAMAQGKELMTVTVSAQIPHITLSASSAIDAATRDKIRAALLAATQTPQGQAMLQAAGFREGFEPTEAGLYVGYSEYLTQHW